MPVDGAADAMNRHGAEDSLAARLEAALRLTREENGRLSDRVALLEERVQALEGRPYAWAQRGSSRSAVAPSTRAGAAASPAPPTRAAVEPSPMCDCCFTCAAACFPCAGCGKEWYCSPQCERLRKDVHGSRCHKVQRASAAQSLIATTPQFSGYSARLQRHGTYSFHHFTHL